MCWQGLECDATVAVIWFGHCWSIETFGHAFGWSINIFKVTACSRNVKGCPSPDPGEKQGERKKEWKSLTNAKQRNETERPAWEVSSSGTEEEDYRVQRRTGRRKGQRETERRTRDRPSRGERPSERDERGSTAWLCSPVGGARSPCGEPVAEPKQERSGDTERPESWEWVWENIREGLGTKWTALVC